MLAATYVAINDYVQALEYYKLAIEYWLANNYTGLSTLHFERGNLDIALEYRMKSLAIYEKYDIKLKEKPFSNYVIQLKQNDILYTFSDGFIDQFGGEKNTKYKTKKFKEFLKFIHKSYSRLFYN